LTHYSQQKVLRKHGWTINISAVVRNSALVPGWTNNFGHLFLTSTKQNYRQQFRADNYKIPCQRKALPVVGNTFKLPIFK